MSVVNAGKAIATPACGQGPGSLAVCTTGLLTRKSRGSASAGLLCEKEDALPCCLLLTLCPHRTANCRPVEK